MNQNKIVPCLWFHTAAGEMREVTQYYKNIFGENFQEGVTIPLGETPSGNAEMCEVHIFEKKYTFMSTANKHHSFNDALAFAINCENQNEIDKFWDYFTQEGEEVQCGWCIDNIGVERAMACCRSSGNFAHFLKILQFPFTHQSPCRNMWIGNRR